MRHSAYQIGVLRDFCGNNSTENIFELSLNVIQWAKNIKESYNSHTSLDVRFDDLNISSSTALSYAIWHSYTQIEEAKMQAQALNDNK